MTTFTHTTASGLTVTRKSAKKVFTHVIVSGHPESGGECVSWTSRFDLAQKIAKEDLANGFIAPVVEEVNGGHRA